MEGSVWGWTIVFYLWAAGLAGGSYMVAALVNLWDGRWRQEVMRGCTYFTIPMLAIGASLLTTDLGRPSRVWHLWSVWRPTSPMWIGTLTLLLGAVVAAAVVIPEVLRTLHVRVPAVRPIQFFATWVGLVFAVLLVVYVAVLLASTSRVLWSATVLLPALFTASAFSMGAASLTALLTMMYPGFPLWIASRLRRADTIFLLFELVVLAALVLWLAFFSTPAANQAAQEIAVWPFGPAFWVGAVILGLLAPLAIELRYGKAIANGGVLLTVIGPVLVLVGGLALRYVIVFGGQIQGWLSRPM